MNESDHESDRLSKLQEKVIAFRDARNWKQFHNPKDLSLSITLEASELLEHFQWKNGREIELISDTEKIEIGEEMADVFIYLLTLAHELDIDIISASENKIIKNGKKYPEPNK